MPRTHEPHIIVTDSVGARTSLLLREQSKISRGPITGLGQVVTTGDTAERADQRTPQVIFGDQTGGMSAFAYVETEGILTFTVSDCDTRSPGAIVLPPIARAVSSGLLALGTPTYVEVLDLTSADIIAWQPYVTSASVASPAFRVTTGNTSFGISSTTPAVVIDQITGFTRFNNRYIFVTERAAGLFYSSDAVTWNGNTYAVPMRGVCVHDNKVYIWNKTTSRLEWHTDPTATTGWVASVAQLVLQPNENVVQLLTWRDASGRTAIYVLTNQRLFWYDEDADVLHLFYDFTDQARGAGTPRAHVWRRDGNLYLVFQNSADNSPNDSVLWFSGTTNLTAPNKQGGLPLASRVSLTHSVGGLNWQYFFGTTPFASATNPGRLLAMNDQQGWHTVYTGASAAAKVVGGGYGRGRAFAALANGNIVEVIVPDTLALPLLAGVNERAYLIGTTFYHEYAYTDGGTPNMFKQGLWVAVKSLDHTSASKVPGLASTCQLVVQYQRDTDTAWTTLGTLTSASTFPAVLPINSGFGVQFKQLKLRIGLSSGTTTNTPVVTSLALAYLRQEVPRYAYTAVIDLRYGGVRDEFYKNRDRAQLLAALESWTQPGAVVQLEFAGGDEVARPPGSTRVLNCTVQFSGVEDPEFGPDSYSVVLSDVSSPASG